MVELLMRKSSVPQNATIKQAMMAIELSGTGIAMIVDDAGRLLGIMTDADIRRLILNGVDIGLPAADFMNRNFISASVHDSKAKIRKLFRTRSILQVPILDDSGAAVDLIMHNQEDFFVHKENYAVIMAGGLGTRLRPLTLDIPKPMLKIGNRPILETIINELRDNGFRKILISVNYKAELIETYFRDGGDFDVEIDYIREDECLGTAGALSLARERLVQPFLVINGDLLSKIDYSKLLNYHLNGSAAITVGTKPIKYSIPYGVLELEDTLVSVLREKPDIDLYINSGIYCLDPEVLGRIPQGERYDITELIRAYSEAKRVSSYLITEYWIDIGRMSDYEKALEDYAIHFK